MGDGFWHGDIFWHGSAGGLWMILVWLLPILLLVWGVSAFRGGWRGGGDGGNRSARVLLDEEYAKSRIDREEYLRRKKDLSG